jgi:hypothetical protein
VFYKVEKTLSKKGDIPSLKEKGDIPRLKEKRGYPLFLSK